MMTSFLRRLFALPPITCSRCGKTMTEGGHGWESSECVGHVLWQCPQCLEESRNRTRLAPFARASAAGWVTPDIARYQLGIIDLPAFVAEMRGHGYTIDEGSAGSYRYVPRQ